MDNKVVFITPMRNAAAHLKELINSVKEQRNENWAHVLVDDMSNDESFNLALELTSGDDRFEVRQNRDR